VPEPIVVASKVQKSFRHMGRTLEVLRGVDLEIRDGEMLGIVGPSGAGKSTLLHCIGTLDIPTKGSIRLAGEELTALPGWRLAELRNKTIGFVFQFHHLLPEFNALENVMMPGLVQGRA
jgi:lipoprotein-releasing system ATP-binding protein